MAWLERQGVRLHYLREGAGEPVLLIQGVGVGGCGWSPQVQGLHDHCELITFDNRGVGSSHPCTAPISIETMASDAQALMNEAGWKSAHIVGHSMGGVIAQQLALDCPDRIRSLSLLCTFARGKDAARLTPWVLWMTLRTRLGTRTMRRQAFLEMILPAASLKGRDPDEIARELQPIMGRDLADSPSILMKQVRALARHDTSRRLGELHGIPTWVLSAADDPIAPPRFGQDLAHRIPGARFEVIPHASHAVIIHEAKVVNEKLSAFFRAAVSTEGHKKN